MIAATQRAKIGGPGLDPSPHSFRVMQGDVMAVQQCKAGGGDCEPSTAAPWCGT
jgi:hypothetical protein